MKQMKRLLAFIMVLFMAFSVLPGSTIQADAAKKKTVKVKKVTLNKKSATLIKGSKLTLKVTFSPKKTTQKKLVWSTSNKKVATVTSKGIVKAVKAGKATITVKVKGTTKKATCKVTVKNPVKVKKITLNAKSVSLYEGSKKTLKATLSPKNTTEKTITWSTSNKKVATVTSKGVVKAVKKGTATITAKVKGTSKKATCKITVKQKTPPVVYGKLEVLDITQEYLGTVSIGESKIALSGALETMKSLSSELKFKFNEDGVTYTLEKTKDGSVDTPETWKLTLKGKGNRVKTYEVTYTQDIAAYYGELAVKDIKSTDDSLTGWNLDSMGIGIVVECKALQFEEIKDKLVVTLKDASATYRFEKDDSMGFWQMRVIGKNGKNRIYNVYLAPDYDAIYGDFAIESITLSEGKLTKCEIVGDMIELAGLLPIQEAIGKLEFTFKTQDEIKTTIIPTVNEIYWNVLLEDSNGNTRTYSMAYQMDFGDLQVTDAEIESKDVTRVSILGNIITIYGTKESFAEVKDSLVVNVKNEDIKCEFDKDSEYRDILRLSDGVNERIYLLYYQIDYDFIYGDLRIEDIKWKGEVAQAYLYVDMFVVQANAEKFDDVKDDIEIVIKDKNAKYRFEYSASEGKWYLILKALDGTERTYSVSYTYQQK